MKTVRCAIYTRKSSEEGPDQTFNSLDAQREACAAYVLSQASEGWTALPDFYDDGGLSGGSLDRPALQRLLGEIAAGRVDTVVVYKVDRLTRSLLDFSKLVEAFDKSGTSFVSVTQSFNTTTSMGRLTLNMLLSFAQFEREVTAERIRDKIAASKAKGMWMGGTPPLGYAPDGRSLKVVEAHADIVREIFALYLELKNVRLVAERLAANGIGAPARTMITTGRMFGGVPFGRGQLYKLLTCPTYVGEIHHRGQIYAALHDPIIARNLWDRVQALLAENRQGERAKGRAASPSLLSRRLVDAGGAPLIAAHANKGKVRYRYYVSKALQQGDTPTGLRIPAREIENLVCERLAAWFHDLDGVMWSSGAVVPADAYMHTVARAKDIAARLQLRDRALVGQLISEVRVERDGITITCVTATIVDALGATVAEGAPATISLHCDVRLTRTGRAMRLIHDNGAVAGPVHDRSLIRLLVKARTWWAHLRGGELDIKTLAEAEGVSTAWITRVVRLAFLSPTVVEAILAGNARAGVDAAALVRTGAVAASWAEQRMTILPGTM